MSSAGAGKATIKDVAKAAGVSATTVHRALLGKGGVGDEKAAEIKRLAAGMGYKVNYMASALKRRDMRIAIAMPEPTMDNRYYYLGLWTGARQFLSEVEEFSVEPVEFYYPLASGSNGAMLKEIYENHSDKIDGLLTVAVKHGQSSYFIEKLADKGIPITLIGSDLYRDSRLCCVKTYDEMAGGLAAELLTRFYGGADFREKIIVTGIGDSERRDRYLNIGGFEKYFEEHAPNARLIPVYGEDMTNFREQLKAQLASNPDTYAVYSCSARHTVQMCRAAAELGLTGKIKLIGNDCFPESVDYLKQGVLTAIIDKKSGRQGYLGMKTLFNYLVKAEYPQGSMIYVKPSVVMKSNVETEMTVE